MANSNPFDNTEGTFLVLVNDESRHSLWPASFDIPTGWTVAHPADNHAACVHYVDTHWTDSGRAASWPRPSGPREARGSAALAGARDAPREPSPISITSMLDGIRPHTPTSLRDVCTQRLERVAAALQLGAPTRDLVGVFRSMTAGWGGAPPEDLPASDVSADGSPVEVAIDLDDADPAVQVAVEAVAPGDAPADRTAAARALMARLVRTHAADEAAWSAVADLFLPAQPAGEHVAMFGAELGKSGATRFKVWFYLDVAGAGAALDLLADGLAQLGLGTTWPAVVRHMARGASVDVPFLLSLDLLDDSAARTKIYFRHYDTSAERLAAQLASYPGFHPGSVAAFCRLMTGDAADFAEQPPVTSLSFVSSAPRVPGATTLYVPLWTCAPNDAVVQARVRQLLATQHRSSERYDCALAGMAGRPLDHARGIHNYISWRPAAPWPRMKIYWSPELRAPNPPPRYRLASADVAC